MADLDLTEAIAAARARVAASPVICDDGACDDCREIIDAAVRAAVPHIARQVREQAAAEIEAHANRHAPKDGNEQQRRMRRHLLIAARVAAPTPTLQEIATALRSAADLAEHTGDPDA